MRIAFMGSPGFAVPALRALHAAGHDVAAVYCQPPRPAGRGQRETPCPVHLAARELGLEVRTPARLRRDEAAQAAFADLDLDAAVVAAYGLILPRAMLDAPRRGCLNIHASLLPRWRGASPIQHAILHGDADSGVTIMRMDEGLDTGPMLLREAVALPPRATTPWLHDRLAEIGARLILRALAEDPPPVPQPAVGVTLAPKLGKTDAALDFGEDAGALDARIRAMNPWPGAFFPHGGEALAEDPPSMPQSAVGVTLAPKLGKTDAALDFGEDAAALDARIRAMNPWPGAFFPHGGEALRVLDAEPGHGSGPPGTVLDGPALTVACGRGALRLTRLQRPGRAALDAEAFLRGFPLPPGTRLGA